MDVKPILYKKIIKSIANHSDTSYSAASPPRCSRASYMNTPAATETLSDCTSPTIGSLARTSLIFSSSGLMPVSSLPMMRSVGLAKSTLR